MSNLPDELLDRLAAMSPEAASIATGAAYYEGGKLVHPASISAPLSSVYACPGVSSNGTIWATRAGSDTCPVCGRSLADHDRVI